MRGGALLVSAAALLLPAAALAAGVDPSLPLLYDLVLILLAAKVMGHLGVLIGQPPVLGELCAGILLGNLGLLGIGGGSNGSPRALSLTCSRGWAWSSSSSA